MKISIVRKKESLQRKSLLFKKDYQKKYAKF